VKVTGEPSFTDVTEGTTLKTLELVPSPLALAEFLANVLIIGIVRQTYSGMQMFYMYQLLILK
jgi:hypothetical protein